MRWLLGLLVLVASVAALAFAFALSALWRRARRGRPFSLLLSLVLAPLAALTAGLALACQPLRRWVGHPS